MTEKKSNQSGQNIEGHQFNMAGDANIGQIGDIFDVGDVTGSYTAIGTGAQLIVNQIEHALSAVDELDKGIQAAERRLARAIQSKLDGYTQLPTTITAEEGRNPYRSLLNYRIEDVPFFYGRREAIDEMLQRLDQNRLTVLQADSGSGKTSLLQAGLAARLLAAKHLPLYVRPYNESPQVAIKRAFLPDYRTLDELRRFRDDKMSLQGFLKRVTSYLGPRKLFILLDQFEEFFLEMTPAKEAFTAELQKCVDDPDLDVGWVLSLREEYFAKLRLFNAVRPFENYYFLETFNIEEARDVIIQPAQKKGVRYDEGLVDRIIDDISHGSATLIPVHVQLVCSTLFAKRSSQPDPSVISAALYNMERGSGERKAAGAEGILRSHLSRTMEQQMSGRERQLAWRVLRTLVTSQKRRAQRSRQVILNELQAVGDQAVVDESSLDHILETLDKSRLVQFDEDDQDELRYELAHEYLLEEIEVDPQLKAIKLAQEILDQEVSYARDRDVLLAKDKYEIINSQLEHLHLDDESRELIEKSEERFEAEQARELRQARALAQANEEAADNAIRAETEAKNRERNTRRWLRVALVLVLLAIIGAGIAIYALSQASDARDVAEEKTENLQAELLADQAIAEAAKESKERDGTLALLLAIESYSRTHNADVHQVLRTIIEERQPSKFALPGAANWASWNADETFLLTGSTSGDELFNGNLMVWARDAYEEPVALLPDTAQIAVWNAAGDRFLTRSWDGPVSVWDVTTIHNGQPRLTLPETASWADWTPDGSRILAQHEDDWKIWDGLTAESNSPLHSFDPNDTPKWSRDGRYLLLFLEDGTVAKLDATSLKPVWTLSELADSATWNSTGSRVLVKREEAGLELWDGTVEPKEPLAIISPSYFEVAEGWSQDGTRVLFQRWGSGALEFKLLDAISGQEIETLDEPGWWAVWEGGDTHIATLRGSGVVDLWDGHNGHLTSSIYSRRENDKRVWYWNDTERRRMDAIGPMIHGLNDQEYSFISLSELPEQISNSSRSITWMGWSNNDTRSHILTWDGAAVTLWNGAGDQPELQFADVLGTGDNGRIPAIQSYDNDQRLLVASESSVKIYPAQPTAWLELACQIAEQNLSWKAWRDAFPEEQFYHRTCIDLPVHPSVIGAVLLERLPEEIDPYLRRWEGEIPETVAAVRLAIPNQIDDAIMTTLRFDDLPRAIQLVEYYEQSFADGQVSAKTLNSLCWSGAVRDLAVDVLPFCNRAAEMEPDNGIYVAGRGLARALTGDYLGAAEDFRYYEEAIWSDLSALDELEDPFPFECYVCQYADVIKSLEAGENPFTPEEQADLRSDWNDNFYEQ